MNSVIFDAAAWSRLQFAFTIIYHYLFPQLTMGLAWFLVYWKWHGLRTGDEQYHQAARFWAKIVGHGIVGLLDWYTLSIALFATVALAAHGATYLTLKTEGAVHDRSARYAKGLWMAVPPLLFVISLESGAIRPDLLGHAIHNPMWWLGLLVICVATTALVSGLITRRETRAFVGSNLLLAGLLATGAAALFPVALQSTLAPEYSLTAGEVAAGPKSPAYAAVWWPIGFALTAAYFVFVSQRYAGKVGVRRDNQGYY